MSEDLTGNPVRPPKMDPEQALGEIVHSMRGMMPPQFPLSVHISKAMNGYIFQLQGGALTTPQQEVYATLDAVIDRLKVVFLNAKPGEKEE